MNFNTQVQRRGHVVTDEEGTVLFTAPHKADLEPLQDVVLMLNFRHLFLNALLIWDSLFEGQEAKEKLAEMVGKEKADAVLAATMLALHPRLWEIPIEDSQEQRINARIAERAKEAFPAIIALLHPDLYPVLSATIGEEGYEKLDRLVGADVLSDA